MAEYYKISRFLTVEDATGAVTLGGVAISDDAGFDISVDIEVDGIRSIRRPKSQTIQATPTLLSVGDAITAAGLRISCIKNLSDTQTITVYSDNGATVIGTIEPGFAIIVEPDGDFVPYLKCERSEVAIKHLSVACRTSIF